MRDWYVKEIREIIPRTNTQFTLSSVASALALLSKVLGWRERVAKK